MILLLILIVLLIVLLGVARSAVSTIASMIVGHAPRGRPWPMPGTSTSFACGIARAVARPPDLRTSLSSVPWMTVTGIRSFASRRLRSRSATIAPS